MRLSGRLFDKSQGSKPHQYCCHFPKKVSAGSGFSELTALTRLTQGTSNAYAKTFNPCFWTTDSSLSAMPLGRFAPVSHFWTVDSLVFR